MSEKIRIQTITPANSDGNDLKNCYFLLDLNDTYGFYSSNNKLLASSLGGLYSVFEVEVDGKNFVITIDSISDTTASGDWSEVGREGVPGSGTFQAQAGGTGDPEPEKSASATS